MKILVLNSGSSSVKYQLLDLTASVAPASPTVLASGLVERIGEPLGTLRHKKLPDADAAQSYVDELAIPDHRAALRLVIDAIVHPERGVVQQARDIDGVGHRIVHGGEHFSAPTLVDEQVIRQIEAMVPLAPLHNPGGLAGIATAFELLPGVPQVAVFDTAFHQTMPPEAYIYPLPYEYYEELRVRRYGFHGSSHGFVFGRTAEFLGRAPGETSAITIHLGNGCSMAAVRRGQCLDTSMGLTPLAGLMMGTRCGDIDPALYAFLAEHKGLTIKEMDAICNKASGLKGVCGVNDMRDVHARRAEGDARAQLAFTMFCRRVTHYVGAYLALLGECHALSFTAGIGENDAAVRAQVCATLGHLGARLDPERNETAPRGATVDISQDDSPIRILVVPTNEELAIAVQTLQVLQA